MAYKPFKPLHRHVIYRIEILTFSVKRNKTKVFHIKREFNIMGIYWVIQEWFLPYQKEIKYICWVSVAYRLVRRLCTICNGKLTSWLVVYCLMPRLIIFHSYGDDTTTGEGLAYFLHLRPLSREVSLSCHINLVVL